MTPRSSSEKQTLIYLYYDKQNYTTRDSQLQPSEHSSFILSMEGNASGTDRQEFRTIHLHGLWLSCRMASNGVLQGALSEGRQPLLATHHHTTVGTAIGKQLTELPAYRM